MKDGFAAKKKTKQNNPQISQITQIEQRGMASNCRPFFLVFRFLICGICG